MTRPNVAADARQDNWLVGDLLAQMQVLVARVEARQRLPPEEILDMAAGRAAAAAAGLAARAPLPPRTR